MSFDAIDYANSRNVDVAMPPLKIDRRGKVVVSQEAWTFLSVLTNLGSYSTSLSRFSTTLGKILFWLCFHENLFPHNFCSPKALFV